MHNIINKLFLLFLLVFIKFEDTSKRKAKIKYNNQTYLYFIKYNLMLILELVKIVLNYFI